MAALAISTASHLVISSAPWPWAAQEAPRSRPAPLPPPALSVGSPAPHRQQAVYPLLQSLAQRSSALGVDFGGHRGSARGHGSAAGQTGRKVCGRVRWPRLRWKHCATLDWISAGIWADHRCWRTPLYCPPPRTPVSRLTSLKLCPRFASSRTIHGQALHTSFLSCSSSMMDYSETSADMVRSNHMGLGRMSAVVSGGSNASACGCLSFPGPR